ncbi:MAG: alpha-1,2-fucosyltransferase, partial [Cyanobacteriota bacterium]
TLPGAGARGLRSDPAHPPPLHVFSDDPAWCQAHLSVPGWAPRLEGGQPETDLARLAAARVLILSNSSFSAVAAHLAQLRDSATVVIAPDRWRLVEDGRLGDLRGPDWLTVEA